MGSDGDVRVRRVGASEWEAQLVADGEVQASERASNCPAAIGRLYHRIERDRPG
jgi:hypothetical protein